MQYLFTLYLAMTWTHKWEWHQPLHIKKISTLQNIVKTFSLFLPWPNARHEKLISDWVCKVNIEHCHDSAFCSLPWLDLLPAEGNLLSKAVFCFTLPWLFHLSCHDLMPNMRNWFQIEFARILFRLTLSIAMTLLSVHCHAQTCCLL